MYLFMYLCISFFFHFFRSEKCNKKLRSNNIGFFLIFDLPYLTCSNYNFDNEIINLPYIMFHKY